MSEELVCPTCKKEYAHGGSFFANHVASCKGPQATSGRIAARDGTPPRPRAKKAPSAKKSAKPKPEPTSGPRGMVAHALSLIPKGMPLAEWLSVVMPEGTWADMSDDDLAACILGHAVQIAREPAA